MATNRRIVFHPRTIGRIVPERTAVDWFDQSTKGLSLQVTPAGSRSWFFIYRAAGKARRVKLGTWPAVDLPKARTLAATMRVRVETEGADPAIERAAARTAFTIGELAALYINQWAKLQKKTWKDDGIRLARYVLPEWGARGVATITRVEVHTLLDRIAIKTPIQANRIQSLISKLFNFAIDRGYAEVNPCHRMAKRGKERARVVVLDDAALRTLWAALDAAPGDATDAIRLRLLTGQRGGEVHAMRWADLDGGVWTMPDTKNGRAHRLPLSGAAGAVLAARRAAPDGDPVRVFRYLDHQDDGLRELAAIHGGAYRWHDLRRTFASRLAGLGVGEDVISRLLNHAKRGITATVYNQYAYDREKLAALELWAGELARIVEDKPAAAPGPVLAFRRG